MLETRVPTRGPDKIPHLQHQPVNSWALRRITVKTQQQPLSNLSKARQNNPESLPGSLLQGRVGILMGHDGTANSGLSGPFVSEFRQFRCGGRLGS